MFAIPIVIGGSLHVWEDFWGLPGADRGIDSLALNLSTAVQAKDYKDYVPLERLATLLGETMR